MRELHYSNNISWDDLVGAAQEEVREGVQACLVHRCPLLPPRDGRRQVQLDPIARLVGVREREFYFPGPRR